MWGNLSADVTKSAEEKKKSKETVSIPEVRDLSVRFVEGQSVDIELDAAVGSVKQPDFIIRQQPANGTLTNLRPHQKESNKAIITYTHKGVDIPLMDRFTYACRIDGGPMSAPAVVTLSGQRMAPKLNLLNTPNFSKIFVGGESSAKIILKNEGTAPYFMNIAWPDGWVGPASIDVPMGKTIDIQIIFRPKRVGEFRFEAELQKGVASSKLILFGDCLRPLTVSPSNITLTLDTKTGMRTGSFSLINGRPETVVVTLKMPARLSGIAEMEIPAQGKVDVAVSLGAQDVEIYAGEIGVVTGTTEEKIGVQAAPKPAELRLVTPENGVLDFSMIDQRKKVEREVILLNAGGEAMVVQLECQQPFSIEASGHALRIEPLQQRSVKVTLKSETSGKLDQQLKVIGGTSTLSVRMLAEVKEAKGTTEPRPIPMRTGETVVAPLAPVIPAPGNTNDDVTAAGRTAMQSAFLAYLQMEGLPIPKQFINPYLERVASLALTERTSSSLTLAWKKPDIAPAGWILETSSQIYSPAHGVFIKAWNRVNNWKPVEGSEVNKIAVRLHSLNPTTQYEIRVMGVDREGKVSEPSPQALFSTAQAFRIPSWISRIFLLGALGLVIYVLYRVRRGDFQEV